MAINKIVYPRRPPYPDPETADMTEAERLAEYKQSAAYQARQARYRQGEWLDRQPGAQRVKKKHKPVAACAGCF